MVESSPVSGALSCGEFHLVYDPSVGEDGPWYINDHTFVRGDDGTWHLFGITHAEPFAPFDEKHLAHATAPALHGPWTKQPFALDADPEAGEHHLWAPHVIAHGGTWWMFYCAGGETPDAYRLHLATSDDLWSWTRHPANPLVVDGYEARDPMVLRVDGRWVMYYTATSEPGGGHHVVVATQSDDLVHWEGREIVYTDPLQGDMAGPTESPFVVEHHGQFHLLIGPDWAGITDSLSRGTFDRRAYRRTRVIAGRSHLEFSLDDLVGTVDAHAAEVIVDVDGSTWVSHCGWGQGGVFLAPFSLR